MALPVQEGALETGIPPHLWRPIASGIGATMTIIASAWALGLQAYLAIGLYPQQFIAMILALALPLAFLTLPLRSGTARTHVPWHDAAAAALALIVSLYIAIRFPEVVNQ